MREIKFRAWGKISGMLDKRNGSNFELEVNAKGQIIPLNKLGKTSVILMQFTGLKDKNGKEIYEGDILKINDWDYLIKFGERTEIMENNVGFYCIRKAKTVETAAPFIHGICFLKEGEIIGNIYENEDLLNSNK